MSWQDVLSAFGVCLALVCASFGLSCREAILPLFIGSNYTDTDTTSTQGDEQEEAENNETEDYDPYTEKLPMGWKSQHATQEVEEQEDMHSASKSKSD